MEQLATYFGATGGGTTPPDAVKLDPPTNLRQTGATTTSVTIEWTATPNSVGSKLRMNGNVIAYTGTGTSKTVTGLSPGVTPSFDVLARGNGTTTSDSDYSTPIQARTSDAAMPTVAVDAQRNTTLSNIPAGTVASDYEYQFRQGPSVSESRQADVSQMLAAGESPTDYEYQVR